jgi:hypothetical protein
LSSWRDAKQKYRVTFTSSVMLRIPPYFYLTKTNNIPLHMNTDAQISIKHLCYFPSNSLSIEQVVRTSTGTILNEDFFLWSIWVPPRLYLKLVPRPLLPNPFQFIHTEILRASLNMIAWRSELSSCFFVSDLATGCGLDDRGFGVQVSVGARIIFSPRRRDRHPASYPMGSEDFSPGVKLTSN